MKVSVILTVINEEQAIGRLMESLGQQSRAPDEIVICDGGSIDGTAKIIEAYQDELPLLFISFPGSNISQGRNRAIMAAAGPIIASTDAGVRLAPNWLEDLVRPIEEKAVPVTSGWFEPDPKTEFETAMSATVLPALEDIDGRTFLPSSRSAAYLKSSWQAAGGYPEWLDYGEDLVFDLALRERFGPFTFVPTAVVYFRPRGDLSSYARQYYLYARGDGKANLWPKRHAVRYATYLVGLPLMIWSMWQGRWYGFIVLIGGGVIYSRRPAQRLSGLTRTWQPVNRAKAFMLIPIIRLVGDVAKMIGYPIGLIWRWRNRLPFRQ